MTERVCTACAFCAHLGTGYSEYTIMGEDVTCLLGLMPGFDTDMPEAKQHEINATAETCPVFREGTGPRLGLYTDNNAEELKDWVRVNFGEVKSRGGDHS